MAQINVRLKRKDYLSTEGLIEINFMQTLK